MEARRQPQRNRRSAPEALLEVPRMVIMCQAAMTYCRFICVLVPGFKSQDGMRSSWPCGYWKDGEYKRSGECPRKVLLRVQLFTRDGLPGSRQYLQG